MLHHLFFPFAMLASVAFSAVVDVDVLKHGSADIHVSVDGGKTSNNSGGPMTNNFINVFAGCCGNGDDKDKDSGKEETSNATTVAPETSVQIDDPWVMVIGGDNSSRKLIRDVEVYSLDEQHHPVPACLRRLGDFPVPIEDGSGGSVQDGRLPLVCGGRASETQHNLFSDKCFSYEAATDSWVSTGRMPTIGGGFGYAVHPKYGLVISAGDHGVDSQPTGSLNALHMTKDGATFPSGLANLPLALAYTCLVVTDEDTVYSIGGYDGKKTDVRNAYEYSFRTNKWTEIPPMPTARSYVSCGATRDSDGKAKEIVAAGGYIKTAELTNVELFQLDTMTWRTGTPLPTTLGMSRSIPFKNSFAIIGGNKPRWVEDLDTVYIYDPTGAGSWRLLPKRLSQAKRQTIAFNIKKEIFPACP